MTKKDRYKIKEKERALHIVLERDIADEDRDRRSMIIHHYLKFSLPFLFIIIKLVYVLVNVMYN